VKFVLNKVEEYDEGHVNEFSVEDNSEVKPVESLETLSSVGTISVVLIPIQSFRRVRQPNDKKVVLREIGAVSEETIKGDVRSHMIRYALIADTVQRTLIISDSHQVISRNPSPGTNLRAQNSL